MVNFQIMGFYICVLIIVSNLLIQIQAFTPITLKIIGEPLKKLEGDFLKREEIYIMPEIVSYFTFINKYKKEELYEKILELFN